ncbi:transcription initiation factor TFIID subunit 11 family protein [Aspergillus lucknowensis]|uniref:HTAFII28-like protein conserved region-domain-containing protein n=1 Tax=Aspergillus lucknowensis TaxID=176173 RepID=A0ABR4LFR3_9EURO
MSSPPPPSNPLKRSSIPSASQQPNPKRPRAHPLRQTSFPIDPDLRPFSATATSDAGSVTGSFTGSLGGTSVDGVFKRKRGRKSKAEKERERERERDSEEVGSMSASVRASAGPSGGGYMGGGPGTGGGTGARDNGDEVDEDDDFDDEGGELLGREEGATATDTEAEKKNLALLVDAFSPLQSERYDLFKRAKLRKETLRRIVNHALSQSVPASVVTTINGFTKVFAGEIIEKARSVQKEWAEAHDQAALARLKQENAAADANGSAYKKNKPPSEVKPEDSEDSNPSSSSNPKAKSAGGPESVSQISASATGGESTAELPPNPHRGQLLPSHLREALRRYKRDGEGGGVGFSGLSLGNLEMRGSVTWSAGGVGGRRLFR